MVFNYDTNDVITINMRARPQNDTRWLGAEPLGLLSRSWGWKRGVMEEGSGGETTKKPDTYGDSLVFVNNLLNKEFGGSVQRKVGGVSE